MTIHTVPTLWQIIKTDRVTTLALAIMSAPLAPLIVIVVFLSTTTLDADSFFPVTLAAVLVLESIFLVIGWSLFRKRTAWIKHQFQRGAWLDAHVEAISTVKSARGNLDIPVIEISYKWQGQSYHQKLYWFAPSGLGSRNNAPSIQPGHTFQIIIDPQNPPPSHTASNFPNLSSFFKLTQGILVPALFFA